MKPARAGDLKIRDGRYCAGNAVAAFVLGVTVGAAVYHTIAPAQADSVGVVSAVIFKVGQKLCSDWSGLANVEKVGEQVYTFSCRRYAEFKKLEVR